MRSPPQLLSSADPTLQPSDAGSRQRQKQSLRSSASFHLPVHNGSAQLSYFIYSCTARNSHPSRTQQQTPPCAPEHASKRALHPIHNVKQPKNKVDDPKTFDPCSQFFFFLNKV